MQVFKFGGASVKDAAAIQNLGEILKLEEGKPLLLVISAMGKTTNALEALAKSYFYQREDTYEIFEQIKAYHFEIIHQLFDEEAIVFDEIINTFVEIDWILEDDAGDDFNFIYDQIVSMGELVASKIVGHYLNSIHLKTTWIDARSYIQTDNLYREAKVNWLKTTELMLKDIPELLKSSFVITQGFIGNTSENFTTTLGREGSDYSAAIFASCLNADSVTVWKDVPGILNADPKQFKDCIKFDELSYEEAIEMTYYGATVIHPKTIKPLQNKQIPLFVRPFLNPTEKGTVIKEVEMNISTPIIILKQNQLLVTLSTKDLSFITENHLRDIFQAFADTNIKVNTLQISALDFFASFDADEQKFDQFKKKVEADFEVKLDQDLKLFTFRHASEELIKKYVTTKICLEHHNRNTAQFVVKNE